MFIFWTKNVDEAQFTAIVHIARADGHEITTHFITYWAINPYDTRVSMGLCHLDINNFRSADTFEIY